MKLRAFFFLMVLSGSSSPLDSAGQTAILPPPIPWSGLSRALMVPPSDPWITPAERSSFQTTPRYDETVAWLKRLVSAAPDLRMVSLGKSPEGRDIWMVIASKEKKFTPEGMRAAGKPIVFAQASIHAGEMDGKDAGLMLLRDMTVRGTRRNLLETANFLFVPIFNVDGHERFSPWTRMNQRGPEQAGYRTTSRNLNLNRDYAKLDTPEMRAMVQALHRWDPHLYLDLHVTDGADYQYDITFGQNGPAGFSPAISRWIDHVLFPGFARDLKAAGHIPGPAVWFADALDPAKGRTEGPSDLRFSTGYGDARHIPSILVENHSLKPYDQRVLGTYVLLESALRRVAQSWAELQRAIASDRERRAATIPLRWKVPETPPRTEEFLGIEQRVEPSEVSGALAVEYTGKPVTVTVPILDSSVVATSASRPGAYWVPPGWQDVIERMRIHGIQMETIRQSRDVEVVMYRLRDAKFETKPFEGHIRVDSTPIAESRKERFPPNSVRISTDQPLGDLVVLLLEPASPDSFFQWGFFPEPLQQTEYVEGYIMEPTARRMLDDDAALATEFQKKLAEDEKFRSSSTERLQWFYSRTPYFDERWLLYPVAREIR